MMQYYLVVHTSFPLPRALLVMPSITGSQANPSRARSAAAVHRMLNEQATAWQCCWSVSTDPPDSTRRLPRRQARESVAGVFQRAHLIPLVDYLGGNRERVLL